MPRKNTLTSRVDGKWKDFFPVFLSKSISEEDSGSLGPCVSNPAVVLFAILDVSPTLVILIKINMQETTRDPYVEIDIFIELS
jgi:hypothetical protein